MRNMNGVINHLIDFQVTYGRLRTSHLVAPKRHKKEHSNSMMTPQHADTKQGGPAHAQPPVAAEGALTMKTLAAAVGKVAFGGKESTDSSKSISSSSSGGKCSGSGSGGGYNADYSSSECSSDTSLQWKVSHMLVDKSALGKRQSGGSIGESTEHGDGRLALHVASGQDQQQTIGASSLPNRRDDKSTATTDELLDALQKSFLGRGSLPPMEPATTPTMQQGQMPQLNGVRIQHPMDPRIDISTVGHVYKGHDPGMPLQLAPNGDATPATGVFPQSEDHYMHMLEAIRPFFSAYGFLPAEETIQQNGASDPLSSEGFTDFFTTTCSNATSSDNNSHTRTSVSKPQDTEGVAKAGSNRDSAIDDSDASSMVVLARVKRKHLKKQADQRSCSSTSSAEERNEQPEPHQQQTGESGEGTTQEEAEPQAVQDARLVAPVQGPQESSSSTSSSEERADNDAPQEPLHLQQEIIQREGAGIHHYATPLRIVSESSDMLSCTTSNAMATTTSGSGTGSGSGGNSGSGSPNGSSGSGNEGKGSSTDNANSEHSGGEVKSNSDENITSKESKPVVETGRNAQNWKEYADASYATGALQQDVAPIRNASAGVQPPSVAFMHPIDAKNESSMNEGDHAVREKKLQDKKRKRMNMRREYEEQVQQQMESSESSQDPSEIFLRPGKPLLLDEALSFAKTTR